MTPVSRPIIALGILNVDAGRYSFDARAKLLVAQDLLLLLQSTKTPLTASAENSLFQNVFSVIELANAVLERHAVITYAANVFMAPSWWLTNQSNRRLKAVRVDCRVRTQADTTATQSQQHSRKNEPALAPIRNQKYLAQNQRQNLLWKHWHKQKPDF